MANNLTHWQDLGAKMVRVGLAAARPGAAPGTRVLEGHSLFEA